mgnify:CR=1 FL=1
MDKIKDITLNDEPKYLQKIIELCDAENIDSQDLLNNEYLMLLMLKKINELVDEVNNLKNNG